MSKTIHGTTHAVSGEDDELDAIMEDLIVGHNFEYAREALLAWRDRAIHQREQSLAKAYGGCTNCYGKGYATVNDAWHGHDTDTDIGSPGGYVSGGDRNAMKLCSCDRGKQLEKMLAKHTQSLTKSLLAEVEKQMVGEDEELYTDFMNIRSPIRGFTEAEKRNRNRAKQREILDKLAQAYKRGYEDGKAKFTGIR